jgi:K+-sensing histidine kinase KdpD
VTASVYTTSTPTAEALAREHFALAEYDLRREVALYRTTLYAALDRLHEARTALATLQGRYERLLDDHRALRAGQGW